MFGPIKKFVELSKLLPGVVWGLVPAALIIAGLLYLPALNTPVGVRVTGLDIGIDLSIVLLASAVIACVWLYMMRSSFSKVLGAVSIVLALVLTGIIGWKMALGQLVWGYVVPYIASLIAAYISISIARFNGAQGGQRPA